MALGLKTLLRKLTPAAALLILCTVLALTGCGRKQAESILADTDPSAPGDNPQALVTAATNDSGTIAHGFARKLQESAFVVADPAVKESYARALIAFDIGDYARAFAELKDLSATAELSQAQLQEANELLGKTLAAAPELATNNSAIDAASSIQSDTFALAAENQPPFSTADPAIRETFDRAKAAFNIGNFEVALAELQSLVTNAQLNWQQKYAAQSLLDKTPRPVPGTKR